MEYIKITYYLPNQSKLMSEPQIAILEDMEVNRLLLSDCEKRGYEILSIEKVIM